jgi:Ca-activated chloride channel family protein
MSARAAALAKAGVCALVVSGLGPAAPAPAQTPTFGSRSEIVVLSATAVDKSGRPIEDLKRDELRIFDEGRPQRIVHFSASRDLNARMLLLVDASGSMNAKMKTTSSRMAVQQLMAALDAGDEVALAGFDSRYFGVIPFTRDRKQILAGFKELQPWGTTALHDALDHAARDLASHGEGRRAVVVITDGIDTASTITPDEVIARSRTLDVPIYTVSVLSPLDDPRSPIFTGHEREGAATAGSAVLARYAALSGGAAFAVSDFKGLKHAADQISRELKHQYRLGYDPPDSPPRFRRIEVRTTRKGVVIRTRSGYMPPS